MELGKHLRELFRMRVATAICFLLAGFAAISISYKVSVAPPALEPRSIEIASATSEVLIDTPLSSAIDLRQGSSDIESMTMRATLLGNVIASPPVLDYVAKQVGVPAYAIQAQAPLTPDHPRPVPMPGHERSAKDILKIPDDYRINVQVDPSVPIMRVIAQAPTTDAAEKLSEAAVTGLKNYLDQLAVQDNTPAKDRVRLEPLGNGHGVVINGGVRIQASAVAFFIVFGLSAAATIFFARVRRGWSEGPDADANTPAGPLDEPLTA